MTTWPAPFAAGPVRGVVRVPGSKSMTNRALVLSALAEGPSELRGALIARDTLLMMAGLRAMGCELQVSGDVVAVTPPVKFQGNTEIDCGLAGTVMRFLPPVATLADGPVAFDGDERARQRPLAPLMWALSSLGADISGEQLPLTVHGNGHLAGGSVVIDASQSSQFISALLLSAPRFDQGLDVRHRGIAIPSLPHIEMTVSMMRSCGAQIIEDAADPTDCRWQVTPGPLSGGELLVEPDLSNAGPFLAAAMVTAGEVTIPGWPQRTDQAGDALRGIFAAMGATTHLDHAGLHLQGPAKIKPVEIDMSALGELVPTVVAVAAFADGPSQLIGVAHLRGHETDRLAALAAELRRVGCGVIEHADGLTIEPAPMQGAVMECYHDHRMATFAAVIGLRVPDVELTDVATTGKTMPDFPRMWTQLIEGP